MLVKVEYAGICGSDMHVYHGDFGSRIRLPLVPGHEFSGTVVRAGPGVEQSRIGDRVVVDPILWCGKCAACQIQHYPACVSLRLIGIDMHGGFGEYVAVPENNLYKFTENLSFRHAALAEIYSIGFHACNRAGLGKEDTVAIWGMGRVGQSILQAARTITGNPIYCIDVLEPRLRIAKQNGSGIVTLNASRQDPVASIRERTGGRGVDVAFEAVGHAIPVMNRPNPVRGCVQSIRGAGTVCVLGLGDEPSYVLMKELIWKEGRIVASRVSHGEFSTALHTLEKGTLKPELLISAEFPASEAQEAFVLLEEKPEKYLKILLKISS